jgi:type VI protein secretion system component VasA
MRVSEMASMAYKVYSINRIHGISDGQASNPYSFEGISNVRRYADNFAKVNELQKSHDNRSDGKADNVKANGADKTQSVSDTASSQSQSASPAVSATTTEEERKNVLNSYTAYMQSAIASSGLDLLV